MTAFKCKWDDWKPQAPSHGTDRTDKSPSVSSVSAPPRHIHGNEGVEATPESPTPLTDKTDRRPVVGPQAQKGAASLECHGAATFQAKLRPRTAPDLTSQDDLLAWLHEAASDFMASDIPEAEADCLAFDRLLWIWSAGNPGRRVQGYCAACGVRLAKDALTLADGATVCTDPENHCLTTYGTGRRRRAVEALAVLGVRAPGDWEL